MSNLSNSQDFRKNFGSIKSAISLPNLIAIQKKSYEKCLQTERDISSIKNIGFQEVFTSIFPIHDPAGLTTLEFIKYSLEDPKYDVEECINKSLTYAAPLKVSLRLISWDIDEDLESKVVKYVKEQDLPMGEIPMMTENGTFIINGIEKVVVSQVHRSPGVFFDHDRGKTHSSGKYLFSARVIPYRGSWLDFEFDVKDLLFCRIDRRKKIYVSTLLRALGLTTEDIYSTFYSKLKLERVGKKWKIPFDASRYKGVKLSKDIIDADSGEVLAPAGKKITARLAKQLADAGHKNELVETSELIGNYVAGNVLDQSSGEVYFEIGDQIKENHIEILENNKDIKFIEIIASGLQIPYIRNTIFADKVADQDQALIEIYKIMRPGEPPSVEAAANLFTSIFFSNDRYDLSVVGRVKINSRLGLGDTSSRVLTKEDIIAIIKKLIALRDGNGEIDDIDHLGNRRVRSVGELIENQFRIGLVRMERVVIERMGTVDLETMMPGDLVNSKPISVAMREFFGLSQLCQFMDQTNPLSEVTHKRRLSALGPGGLSRERAGFEVRDVHPTHYGRICPIETPEGPNIGLINSLATYAKVNELGFIESPYRKVKDKKVTDEVIYLSAIEEGKYVIAQASATLNEKGEFTDELVSCRSSGEFTLLPPDQIDFIDVSPMQLVSVAASLIPFLENDDANRALMGSNMQRQAVPLIRTDSPLVGTGMEALVARDSGACVLAKRDGFVEQVDATRIVIRSTEDTKGDPIGIDLYNLTKYKRSNHDTCMNQKPIVSVGQRIKAGEVIADGPSTQYGELALGRNVLVAFLSWGGYNFEDSIIISENLVREDAFTSVHIEEFEIIARDTRLGPEEITADIPNISEEKLKNLDEAGIVRIGAEVKPGDILVGKVTPKSEAPMTPEEKLLRAIFGEKAADVRDTSLHVPPGVNGTIVDVKIFSRRGVEKDQRAVAIERAEIDKLAKDRNDEMSIVSENVYNKLHSILVGKKVKTAPKSIKFKGMITAEVLKGCNRTELWQFVLEDEKAMEEIAALKSRLDEVRTRLDKWFSSKVEKLQSGDDLPQGALKVVKVFVAIKRKLQPGDKMAGRHGNKGVISKIVRIEDMPHLEDGTVVDMILNPLGIPSRMNVGQIMETHLGWACGQLGKDISKIVDQIQNEHSTLVDLRNKLVDIYGEDKHIVDSIPDEQLVEYGNRLRKGIPIKTPVFNGAKEAEIVKMLEKAGLHSSGQVTLVDGKTGEPFDRKVTVGYKYMLKLHHLVDDKIHARSIGPYSLVTQQPLGGKSHFGGQRFGEMECWALQAYGAAYTLQEMLTVKSDDVSGRIKIYESIIRGDHNFTSGIPESFHVMIKEFRSLCLNVELDYEKN